MLLLIQRHQLRHCVGSFNLELLPDDFRLRHSANAGHAEYQNHEECDQPFFHLEPSSSQVFCMILLYLWRHFTKGTLLICCHAYIDPLEPFPFRCRYSLGVSP